MSKKLLAAACWMTLGGGVTGAYITRIFAEHGFTISGLSHLSADSSMRDILGAMASDPAWISVILLALTFVFWCVRLLTWVGERLAISRARRQAARVNAEVRSHMDHFRTERNRPFGGRFFD